MKGLAFCKCGNPIDKYRNKSGLCQVCMSRKSKKVESKKPKVMFTKYGVSFMTPAEEIEHLVSYIKFVTQGYEHGPVRTITKDDEEFYQLSIQYGGCHEMHQVRQ